MTMPDGGNTINWKDLKKRADDATKPPEPGWYVLECHKADLKSAQTSGNPMISAQFKIVEGAAAGKTVFNNFNLTLDNDFAVGIFFNNMAAFGFTENYFNTNPSLESLAAALVGRRANVELEHRIWQGQARAQFKNVRPLEGALPVPLVTTGPSNPSVPTASPVTSAAQPNTATAGGPPLPF
jgi:Protein of unknown function (DUF669)